MGDRLHPVERRPEVRLEGNQGWLWTLTPLARLFLFRHLAAMADDHELEDRRFEVPAGFRPDRAFLVLKDNRHAVGLAEALLGFWENAVRSGRITERDLAIARARYNQAFEQLHGALKAKLTQVQLG